MATDNYIFIICIQFQPPSLINVRSKSNSKSTIKKNVIWNVVNFILAFNVLVFLIALFDWTGIQGQKAENANSGRGNRPPKQKYLLRHVEVSPFD